MTREQVHEAIRGKLIVSCQALEDEPHFGSDNMALMAIAARAGGAGGIRCNSGPDIRAIREEVDLPLIGIVKRDYPGSCVYITATRAEVDEVAEAGAHILAMDATARRRPADTLEELVAYTRATYPRLLLMADCSNFDEARTAHELGFDYIGTTMSGYTPYTKGTPLPNFPMMRRIVDELHANLIAEGGIWVPEQLREAMACGAHAAVVGTAITRPRDITRRFVAELEK